MNETFLPVKNARPARSERQTRQLCWVQRGAFMSHTNCTNSLHYSRFLEHGKRQRINQVVDSDARRGKQPRFSWAPSASAVENEHAICSARGRRRHLTRGRDFLAFLSPLPRPPRRATWLKPALPVALFDSVIISRCHRRTSAPLPPLFCAPRQAAAVGSI